MCVINVGLVGFILENNGMQKKKITEKAFQFQSWKFIEFVWHPYLTAPIVHAIFLIVPDWQLFRVPHCFY